MSHANETLHYHLPQYVGSDIINPLVDTNGAYSDIDTALYEIAQNAATAIATAEEVKEDIEGSGGVDSRIDAAVVRLDAIEAKDVAQDASILALNSGLATTDGNLATLTTNVSNIDATVAGHTTSIGHLNTETGDLDNRVTALENAPSATVDSAMSDTSEHAVQNKVIKEYVDGQVEVQSATITTGTTPFSATLNFTEKAIGSDSLISVFTDTFGVNPTDVQYTTNSVTVTFADKGSDVNVSVMVR